MAYNPFDYLPDLTAEEKAAARNTSFGPADPVIGGYESEFWFYSSRQEMGWLDEIFAFYGTKGATYSISSSSFFDPHVLLAYDAQGNVIAMDDGSGSYGRDNTTFVAPYTGTYYINASWDQGYASSNQTVTLSIREDLDTVDAPTNIIDGTFGADVLRGTSASDGLYGSYGFDIVKYDGSRAQYVIKHGDGNALKITNLANPGEVDTLTDIERVEFKDRVLTYDTVGIAAQVYRLYQAAFDRVPDVEGHGYYVKELSSLSTSLRTVARNFTHSPEFTAMYGANASDDTVLTALYRNVLGREPDSAGFDYYMDLLSKDQIDVADLLLRFSESPENQAQVVGALSAGYEYGL